MINSGCPSINFSYNIKGHLLIHSSTYHILLRENTASREGSPELEDRGQRRKKGEVRSKSGLGQHMQQLLKASGVARL